jgi:hypothetical protein
MHHPLDHREKAARARRLAATISQPDTVEQLLTFARDYEEIATDLESGAVTVVHPERMPPRRG